MRLLSFFFLTACVHASGALAAKAPDAKAVLKDAKGAELGRATFKDTKEGVEIQLELQGLPPGRHAMHLHDAGKCEAPDFKSAGPHFNPTAKKHGVENSEGAHLGDLRSVEVSQEGFVQTRVVAKGVTLAKGRHSLLKSGGTSLVIHAADDDNKTDPSGNSGDRIACGVIQKR